MSVMSLRRAGAVEARDGGWWVVVGVKLTDDGVNEGNRRTEDYKYNTSIKPLQLPSPYCMLDSRHYSIDSRINDLAW